MSQDILNNVKSPLLGLLKMYLTNQSCIFKATVMFSFNCQLDTTQHPLGRVSERACLPWVGLGVYLFGECLDQLHRWVVTLGRRPELCKSGGMGLSTASRSMCTQFPPASDWG